MKKIVLLILSFFAFTLINVLPAQVVGKMENDTIINYVDINGKKQGKWTKRYNNDQVQYTGYFVNDIPKGEFIRYHKNGKIKAKINYDDNGNADAELFNENGIRLATGLYDSKQERIGLWHIYFDDGTLALVINYKNGKVEGPVTMYYPGGEYKVMEVNYENGKLEGSYKKYFKGNRPQEEGPCVNGLKHGHWKYYNPEGFLTEEGPYVNGRKHGDWIYYDLGDVKDTINYMNDIPDNFEEISRKWEDTLRWAKENQDKFKRPEDYLDNPHEFFRDNK